MLSEKDRKVKNKIEGLKYFFTSLKTAPEEILQSLEGKDDPDSIRQELIVYLSNNDYQKAEKVLVNQEPCLEFYDLGVIAYTNTGNRQKLNEFISWASQQDVKVWHRGLYLYATNQFNRVWRNRPDSSDVHVGSLNENEKEELKELTETIQPILKFIEGGGEIKNKIYKEIIDISLKCFTLLNDKINASKYSRYSDDPFVLAQLVLCELIELPSDLIANLEENTDSYEAQKYALLLRMKYDRLDEKDFEKIVGTFSKYLSSKEQRIEIFQVFNEIAHLLGEDSINILKKISTEYLGEDSRMLRLFNCECLLDEKKLPEAYEILQDTEDESDLVWLQLFSRYLYYNDKVEHALEYIDKARKLLPHPEIIKTESRLAFEAKHYDLSIELLVSELKKDPDSFHLNHNLSEVYYLKGDYESAANCYKKLIQLKEQEFSYYLKLAQCYTQLGRPKEAIEVYKDLCEKENAPLEGFLAKAYLEKIDDPKRAFATILPLKEIYWGNPQYLQAVLDLSYISGHEEYGHQALLKIRELQEKGKAPQEILQVKTIDDLKAHASQWNEKLKVINQNLLKGKFTWLMADSWQNHTTYMGWYVRTQKIDWLMEDPLAFATYSIYSTNGFTPRKEESDDTVRLNAFMVPQKESDVVIDLSVLITLHQLNLLDKCIDYFNNIYIPQEYRVKLLQDSEQLVIHQHSLITSAQAIKRSIASGDISILDDIGTPEKRPLPYINEHTLSEKEEEHYYRLIDLISAAYHSGRLDEMKYNSLKRIANEPSGVDSEHAELRPAQSILVELSTLRSICQTETDALEPILRSFKVFVSKANQIYNSNQISQIENQEMIKARNDELLEIIKGDVFNKETHEIDSQLDEDNIFLASFELAKDKSLPLLTDDRVLQVLSTNTRLTFEYPAFGTDRLLLKFFEEDMIDIDALSDAFLKLMKWRYRFILPSEEILLNLAKRYKTHPPGQDLREVALYIHECMRDPGMFAGQEKTTLNESMAARLFLSWIQLTTKLLAGIWKDPDFSEENAMVFTEWAINEFSPGVPKCLGVNGIHTANNLRPALFNYLYALVFMFEDKSRANKALQCIAKVLKMDEPEYFKAVSEVVDRYGI